MHNSTALLSDRTLGFVLSSLDPHLCDVSGPCLIKYSGQETLRVRQLYLLSHTPLLTNVGLS